MNKKIKIFVVGEQKHYSKFISFEHKIVSHWAKADIVILTGGEDVSPHYYGDEKGRHTSCSQSRDEFEFKIIKRAIDTKKLLVGICRGAQILTVASNGGLIQHVTGHAMSGSHDITIVAENRKLPITSTHHQMMYPFYLNENDYEIIAHASTKLSDTYLNGNDKEFRLPKNFVEPEIVYYRRTNCLAIQGHPEYMGHDYKVVQFINNLILELLDDNILSDEESEDMYNIEIKREEIERLYGINSMKKSNGVRIQAAPRPAFHWDAELNRAVFNNANDINPNANNNERVDADEELVDEDAAAHERVRRNIENLREIQQELMNHDQLMGNAAVRDNNIHNWVDMANMEQRIAEERERQEEDLF